MSNFLVLYPPFTQPAMIYPGAYVIGEAAWRAGFNSSVLDLNADFFSYLDRICAQKNKSKTSKKFFSELEKIKSLRRISGLSNNKANMPDTIKAMKRKQDGTADAARTKYFYPSRL